MDVRIETLASDVYLLGALTPEMVEQIAERVEALINERNRREEHRREDTRLTPRGVDREERG